MEWTTPKHEEIDLNCEISSYANAETLVGSACKPRLLAKFSPKSP